MNQTRWQKVKGLFDAVVELAPNERARFLDNSCGKDVELRRDVESLLDSDNGVASFLENPVAKEVTSLIIEKKESLEAGESFGHYEIVRQIGAGGMGVVYLATDNQLKRQVALKILSAEMVGSREHSRRFEQEAFAASALNHPNILTIYEVGEVADVHFIAAEFVDGETLREKLHDEHLTVNEALEIATQTTSALVAAHAAGIIHRDIKPENIMLRGDNLVKVLDFGLAKLTADKSSIDTEGETRAQVKTKSGMIMGTAAYMSPEQARGKAVDARTDVFSFGVVLYEMLSGKPPFAGDTTNDTIAAILTKEPAPLARFVADLPPELERIVSKTLRKDREERYQNIKDLLIDTKDLKQELEFTAKLEHKNFGVPTSGGDAETKATQIFEINPTVEGKPPEVGTQNISGGIKNHKLGFIALSVLLLAAVGFGLWFFSNRNSTNANQIKSLAILPLKSLDAGENYLGLGIADSVIRRVSQTGEMTVRPTSAVRRYLNEETDALTAARQLNADAVLEGSVQRADERLRVSVNLLRASDGVSLWTDNFDMRMTDIFTIQDTVAQQVASRLRLRLDSSQQARFIKQYTANPVAYEFYVKGIYSFDQRSFGEKAKPQIEATIALFKKAIETDPNYALAHAQLALAYAWTGQFIEPTEAVWTTRAKEEIDRTESLDPQIAETHIARHYILRSAYEGWQIEAAIRELLAAQQIDPNAGGDQLGILYYHVGLNDLSEREIQRTLAIDPTSQYIKNAIVNSYENLHLYNECLAANQKFLGGEPRISCLLGKGRLDEAQTQIEQALAKNSEDPNTHRLKATLLALKGDFRAAEAEMPFVIGKLEVRDFGYHHDTYDIACIYAMAGKSVEAVKWLRETAKTGFSCYPLFERDPYLNRIRQAPEFVQFMTEMKAKNQEYKREFK